MQKIQIKNTFIGNVTIQEGGRKYTIKAEYNELTLSRMRDLEQERKRRQRQLTKALRDTDSPTELIEELEEQVQAYETEMLDEVLVSLPDVELQNEAGEVMDDEAKLDFAKNRIHWAVPLIEGFTKHITSAASKNSKRPAVH